MAYREEYNRASGGQGSYHSNNVWDDLSECIKVLKEHYQEEEENRRSYGRRYDGGYDGNYRYDGMYRGGDYSRAMDHYSGDFSRYRGRPRRRNGQFMRSRLSISPREMEIKEELGRRLMEQYGPEWICEKIAGEAGELIQAVSKHDKYEMMKEFSELCILMVGMESELSEDMIEEACHQAGEYYMRKLQSGGHEGMSPLHRMYYGGGNMY